MYRPFGLIACKLQLSIQALPELFGATGTGVSATGALTASQPFPRSEQQPRSPQGNLEFHYHFLLEP